MGKFDGILLVSDIDGTLLGSDHRIGGETLAAIRHFQAGGGRFTLATGRMPASMAQFLGPLSLNAPAICYNGACIYDSERRAVLWDRHLDDQAGEVLDYVEKHFPGSGIELYRGGDLYFCRLNPVVENHIATEHFTLVTTPWRDIPPPWTKALFLQPPAETTLLRHALLASPFASRYQFVQSGDIYYELLPFGASKGQALLELCRLLGQDPARTIAVGDNENDLDMIRVAGLGVAVENAVDELKSQADHVTVHHEEEAICAVIRDLDRGIISI